MTAQKTKSKLRIKHLAEEVTVVGLPDRVSTNFSRAGQLERSLGEPLRSARYVPASDCIDPDAEAHLTLLLNTWKRDLELPHFSLLTAEASKDALAMLHEKSGVLNKKLRLIRAIRDLLSAKK